MKFRTIVKIWVTGPFVKTPPGDGSRLRRLQRLLAGEKLRSPPLRLLVKPLFKRRSLEGGSRGTENGSSCLAEAPSPREWGTLRFKPGPMVCCASGPEGEGVPRLVGVDLGAGEVGDAEGLVDGGPLPLHLHPEDVGEPDRQGEPLRPRRVGARGCGAADPTPDGERRGCRSDS